MVDFVLTDPSKLGVVIKKDVLIARLRNAGEITQELLSEEYSKQFDELVNKFNRRDALDRVSRTSSPSDSSESMLMLSS